MKFLCAYIIQVRCLVVVSKSTFPKARGLVIVQMFVELSFHLVARSNTHREIFSKFYFIKPKSDGIYHFPIDLEHKRTRPFAVPNQPENGEYNLISV